MKNFPGLRIKKKCDSFVTGGLFSVLLLQTPVFLFAQKDSLVFKNGNTIVGETPSRNSLEFYGAAELNLFDIKDFSLLTHAYVYRSLTEAGRWRLDFSLDLKYDLPLGFYMKAGGTMNFDNQPAVRGKDIDFVTMFSVGWEL